MQATKTGAQFQLQENQAANKAAGDRVTSFIREVPLAEASFSKHKGLEALDDENRRLVVAELENEISCDANAGSCSSTGIGLEKLPVQLSPGATRPASSYLGLEHKGSGDTSNTKVSVNVDDGLARLTGYLGSGNTLTNDRRGELEQQLQTDYYQHAAEGWESAKLNSALGVVSRSSRRHAGQYRSGLQQASFDVGSSPFDGLELPSQSDFSKMTFRGQEIRGLQARGVVFRKGKLARGTKLEGRTPVDGSNLDGADLRGFEIESGKTYFTRERSSVRNCSLRNADLRDAKIRVETQSAWSNFWKGYSIFTDNNVRGADLSGTGISKQLIELSDSLEALRRKRQTDLSNPFMRLLSEAVEVIDGPFKFTDRDRQIREVRRHIGYVLSGVVYDNDTRFSESDMVNKRVHEMLLGCSEELDQRKAMELGWGPRLNADEFKRVMVNSAVPVTELHQPINDFYPEDTESMPGHIVHALKDERDQTLLQVVLSKDLSFLIEPLYEVNAVPRTYLDQRGQEQQEKDKDGKLVWDRRVIPTQRGILHRAVGAQAEIQKLVGQELNFEELLRLVAIAKHEGDGEAVGGGARRITIHSGPTIALDPNLDDLLDNIPFEPEPSRPIVSEVTRLVSPSDVTTPPEGLRENSLSPVESGELPDLDELASLFNMLSDSDQPQS